MDVDILELGDLPEAVQPDARNLVSNSWIGAHKLFRPDGTMESVYLQGQRNLVMRLMAHDRVLVATLQDAPDLFVGWACGDPKTHTLHYVYVKKQYRREGIAGQLVRRLLDDQVTAITHRPTQSHVREWAKSRQWVYDPWQLMRGGQ